METQFEEIADDTLDESLVDCTIEGSTSVFIPINTFMNDFGESLMQAVLEQNPPIYRGEQDDNPNRANVIGNLKRKLFKAQSRAVQASAKLLVDEGSNAVIINGDMGTGKTCMAIALANVMFYEGYRRHIIICPPHLVFKWRREILDTVSDARVWILNGPDTLAKLVHLRETCFVETDDSKIEFFVMGRVRMRMGYHWRPAYAVRKRYRKEFINQHDDSDGTLIRSVKYVSCPSCGSIVTDGDGAYIMTKDYYCDRQQWCKQCNEPLWTLMRPKTKKRSQNDIVKDALCKLPTIGPKTADKLIEQFSAAMLGDMLGDNIYEFVNLLDAQGDFVFSDRQATRIERSLASMEFAFGTGGYQPTEFIKRYLPSKYFDHLIVDEAHEMKNDSSAQGQAMGVLATQVRKISLLTGTLMGGYASDLFYLIWRVLTREMLNDGFSYNQHGSLGTASMSFMREHGILKDIISEKVGASHQTSRGSTRSIRTVKAPGFGPAGVCRWVLPFTVFVKMTDIDADALPSYTEFYKSELMDVEQARVYSAMSATLKEELKQALRRHDTTLLGVVMNALLAWPETGFRPEAVKHPRTRRLLFHTKSIYGETDLSEKEKLMINICKEEKQQNRKVLIYTIYTGKRDTSSRLHILLKSEGLAVPVLRSTVGADKREDWILDQLDRDIDGLICNPELVKTGLDLLAFQTIIFMQTGYNVYTIMQAARRSWRIGQKNAVKVYYLGYEGTAQSACLELMGKKISVTQSTSGEMPDNGLDVLNQDGDSIEIALAKQLIA